MRSNVQEIKRSTSRRAHGRAQGVSGPAGGFCPAAFYRRRLDSPVTHSRCFQHAPAGSSGATLLHPLHYDTGPILVVSQPAFRGLEAEPIESILRRLPAPDTVSSRPLRRRYPGPGRAPTAMRSERKRREDSASLRKRLRTGVVQCAGMLRGQELVHRFPADAVAGTDLLRLELAGLYHLQHVLFADAHEQRGL